MIKINSNDLDSIAKEYLKKLQITNRNRNSKIVRGYYIDNIERFVLAKPSEYDNIEIEFENKFKERGAESFKKFKIYMENQYMNMRNRHGYWLFEKLNIKVCPYCNRQYTFTINTDNRKISPEFDHFYPKSKYPADFAPYPPTFG